MIDTMTGQKGSPATPPTRTDWRTVLVTMLCSVIAAMQIGKAPVALPAIRADFGLDLQTGGWLVGIFSVLGALGGIPVGQAVQRFGDRRMLVIGLGAITAGCLAGAMAPNPALLIASRIAEGCGFLMVNIAAFAIFNRAAAAKDRGRIFGIGGTNLPTGVLIAMLIGYAVPDWRTVWLGDAALALIALTATLVLTRPVPMAAAPGKRQSVAREILETARSGVPILLGSLFGLYSMSYWAIVSFLPTLLTERHAVSAPNAALLTAIVAGGNIVGNLSAGFCLGRGVRSWILITTALTVTGLTGIGIFANGLPLAAVIALCMTFTMVSGMLPATTLAASPRAVPSPHLSAISVGFTIQGSNIGQLAGPVLTGTTVQAFGWTSGTFVVAGCGLIGLLLAISFRRRIPN